MKNSDRRRMPCVCSSCGVPRPEGWEELDYPIRGAVLKEHELSCTKQWLCGEPLRTKPGKVCPAWVVYSDGKCWHHTDVDRSTEEGHRMFELYQSSWLRRNTPINAERPVEAAEILDMSAREFFRLKRAVAELWPCREAVE